MKICPYCWSWENPTRTFGPKHPCFTVYDVENGTREEA